MEGYLEEEKKEDEEQAENEAHLKLKINTCIDIKAIGDLHVYEYFRGSAVQVKKKRRRTIIKEGK